MATIVVRVESETLSAAELDVLVDHVLTMSAGVDDVETLSLDES